MRRRKIEGTWLISYLALWGFVLLQTALLVALLRHIGNLRLWLRQAGVIRDIEPVEEGPLLGTALPELRNALQSAIEPGFELDDHKAKLLLFVPAGFFGCDDLIPAIRDFEVQHANTFQTVIISFTPAVAEQFEVARRQGIQAPIVMRDGWKVSDICRVLTAPYALVADHGNVVRAKLPVGDLQGLKNVIQMYWRNVNDSNLSGGDR